jgi:hypothetical protein
MEEGATHLSKPESNEVKAEFEGEEVLHRQRNHVISD